MVRIALYLDEGGRSVIRSIATLWNGPSSAGTSRQYSGVFLRVHGFVSWHLAHPLTYSSIKALSALVSLKCRSARAMVLWIPGWPASGWSWYRCRIALLLSTSSGKCMRPGSPSMRARQVGVSTVMSWLSCSPLSPPGCERKSTGMCFLPETCCSLKS
jgi:hypothetical protein